MVIDNDILWDAIVAREGKEFRTHRGKNFSYHIKKNRSGELQSSIEIDGNRMIITRATVLLAFHNAVETQEKKGYVKSPRMLGAYGAAYLYPVFLDIGICTDHPDEDWQEHSEQILQEKLRNTDNTDSVSQAGPLCCEFCGYPLNEDFEFCPKCGRKLKAGN